MAGPGQSRPRRRRRRREPSVAPADGADYITRLPLELRARIVSFLPFRQVCELSSLSRAWRRIHDHTPVVRVDLNHFLFFTVERLYHYQEDGPLFMLHESALAGLEAALLRRADEGSGSSTVDALHITYSVHFPGMSHRADRIIALADARDIRVEICNCGRDCDVAWALDLPPSARDLDVVALPHLAPTITGPGAAALVDLRFAHVAIREWSRLPSLRTLTLNAVTIEAAFPPGAWWPLLEELCISVPELKELARLDICLPRLKILEMDEVTGPLMDVTVVAPELEELVVTCMPGEKDYRSFTLQAPQLRWLGWGNQFARRVCVDVGRPGSVTKGIIDFTWNGGFECRKIKDSRALMMRMLKGLLPEKRCHRVPGPSWRKQPWVAPGNGTNHITGLPLELRGRITSFRSFRQVGQLSSLSRPWHRFYDHTPVL
ncbi:hypothetical protein QOZ80_7BG0595060 [Eleusine coracana subsp. coracana]|nr:hypothetical protein QOZ80_7BG0595060 [Eleusine coracana subsp. coracana]